MYFTGVRAMQIFDLNHLRGNANIRLGSVLELCRYLTDVTSRGMQVFDWCHVWRSAGICTKSPLAL